MSDSVPQISIVIANFNGGEFVINTIRKALGQDYQGKYQILLVDDCSTDDSLNQIKKIFSEQINKKGLVLLTTPQNMGVAGAYNTGIKHCLENSDFILKIDNDLLMEKETLSNLVECALHDKKVGIVGGKVYLYDQPEIIQMVGVLVKSFLGIKLLFPVGAFKKDNGQFEKELEVDMVNGPLILIKKSVFSAIGLFDESYGKYGREDFDFNLLAKRAGYKIKYYHKAIAYHKISLSGVNERDERTFSAAKTRVILIKKFFPSTNFYLTVLAYSFFLFYDVFKRKRKFIPLLRGHIAGIREAVQTPRKSL